MNMSNSAAPKKRSPKKHSQKKQKKVERWKEVEGDSFHPKTPMKRAISEISGRLEAGNPNHPTKIQIPATTKNNQRKTQKY
jgi:hypothetical protein